MKILKMILGALVSMRTGLWLLGLQLGLFLAGAFIMPLREEFSEINSVALFDWMLGAEMGAVWWLWASVVVTALLALNTVACSIDSLISKRLGRHWALVVSPQVIHLGFAFLMLAHLMSSWGSVKGNVVMREGSIVKLSNGVLMELVSLDVKMAPQGYPLDWRAEIKYSAGGSSKPEPDYLGPNRPSFKDGYGVYIKDIKASPVKMALLEINRDPGASWALIGGLLFTLGTVALVGLKISREK